MKHIIKKCVFGVLSLQMLTGCFSHPGFEAYFALTKKEKLQDSSLCARFVITQRILAGEYTYTTGETIIEEVDEEVDILELSYNYKIYNGFQGHLRHVHAEGNVQIEDVFPYNETITFDVPYDLKNHPEKLIDPFFDLTLNFTVSRINNEDYGIGIVSLGFENDRYRPDEEARRSLMKNDGHYYPKEEINAEEGFCGWAYHYLVINPNGEYPPKN